MALKYSITHNGSTWNSTQNVDSISLSNGSVTSSITSAGTRTLNCAGKYMNNNLIIGAKTLNCKNKIMQSNIIITSSIAGYVATTTIPSGQQIQAGISGLSAAEIKKCADAIAKNSSINNNVSVCYVDTGSGYYTISVGDQISWTMNGTSYPYRIMGFNHYDKSDGSGKAGILFQMVDCFNAYYPMRSSMSSADGWDDSDLRTTLNSTLYGYLPSDVRSAISQVTIKTAQDVSTSTIITTNDKLFVPAVVEVFGSASYAISHAKGGTNEGVWYPWYKVNNNTSSRKKKVNGSSGNWWGRSPHNWDSTNGISYFCFVRYDGDSTYTNANTNGIGAAPCFCF